MSFQNFGTPALESLYMSVKDVTMNFTLTICNALAAQVRLDVCMIGLPSAILKT